MWDMGFLQKVVSHSHAMYNFSGIKMIQKKLWMQNPEKTQGN